MRNDHTREQEGHNRVQGLKAVVGGMITIEGGRGAIKKRMVQIEKRTAQIKKRTARWPVTKVSMMGGADNGAGSGQQSREGCNNQPLMGAVKASSGWQQQE